MLAVAGAVLAAASLAGDAPCTRAEASRAMAAAPGLPAVLKELAREPSGGPNVLICHDFTRDGRVDMAVTLFSGGTAGDLGWVVFRASAGGWKLALHGAGYKLGVGRVGDDVVVMQPIYRKNDPNCCPTGGFEHERYRWRGSRFATVRTWTDKSFHP
jgi:hypothetical protein